MTAYQKFQKLPLDFASLGLEQGEERSEYFCTPRGARVIGWAGVDGIHYCFVRGFGEMVFAVCPMNLPGEYVRPVAGDFTDFLRLLLACRHASALDQAPMWKERAGLEAFVAQIDPPPALAMIREKFSLEPMEDPWGYMKELREKTDLSGLQFPPEYAQYVPEESKTPVKPDWKVYFGGGFFDAPAGRRPGKEFRTGTVFEADGRKWVIPGVYSCTGGLVMDLAIRVEQEELWAFLMGKTRNNPLSMDALPDMQLTVDGMTASFKHAGGLWWVPDAFAADRFFADKQGEWIVDHYGLDPDCGWNFYRVSFRWEKKPRSIRTLELSLVKEPERSYLPIKPTESGQQIELVNPFTGVNHVLTVLNLEDGRLAEQDCVREDMEIPPHYRQMTWSMEPVLPKDQVTIIDQNRGDQPRIIQRLGEDFSGAAILFSSAVNISPDSGDNERISRSSLHFSPPDEVRWTVVFREERREPTVVHIDVINIP